MNAVETFWTGHTVRSEPFTSAAESVAYLAWRAGEYPLFHEFMGLWGDHGGETVLDYGCGPGNDLVGLYVHGNARDVIGMDVSPWALDLARSRLALHAIDAPLIRVSDERPSIPLRDGSVDYIYCGGVLHHTTHPEAILAEFRRVLRRGGSAAVMVYNRDSIWVHSYIAWVSQVLQRVDTALTVDEAFERRSDDGGCPLARLYRHEEFSALARAAGFEAEYRGGYFNRDELDLWNRHRNPRDARVAPESREFLDSLTVVDGFPHHRGWAAGIGGSYRLVA